jgi:hypothetical protein
MPLLMPLLLLLYLLPLLLPPQGIKVYWHVLEAMLKAEEGRAGLEAAGQLLLRWPFHLCLLACTFELVGKSYRSVTSWNVSCHVMSHDVIDISQLACITSK